MAVGGSVSTPIFKQDGQYLSLKVASAAVTLGQIVKVYSTTSPATVTYTGTSGANALGVIGVAISGNRISRTATAETVAVDDYVTICTRGVCNCTAGGTVTAGLDVQGEAAGTIVNIDSSSYVDLRCLVGRALKTGTTGDVIPVLVAIR